MLQQSTPTESIRSTTPVVDQTIAEEDRKTLQAIVDILQLFTEQRATIPAHQVIAFLRLAMDEGHNNKWYAEKNKMSQGAMSTVLLGLGKKARTGDAGLMLVDDRPSPHSLKEYQLFLTPKGRGLRDKIINRVKKTV